MKGISHDFERAINEHQWIDPQGETTCTCGWICHAGEVRLVAWRAHFAGVLCLIVYSKLAGVKP